MASKWLGAALFLAIVSLILGWIFGMPKIDSMENDIRNALDNKGYQNIQVDMSGNVATLTGDAASDAAKLDAVEVAKNTECSSCKRKWANNGRWHAVRDKMSLKSLAVQTPYTFNAEKDLDGAVTVSGYVPSEAAKEDILRKANRIFNTKPIDRKIIVASGAPDGKFLDVTEGYMNSLAKLDKGNFSQEGYNGLLQGTVSDAGVRDTINAEGQGFPGKYGAGFRANISVPNAVAKVQTVTDCQALFAEAKGTKRILFETNAANIKGAASFDLLNEIAAVANRCSTFNINIGGHTDSVGDAGYNQRLSEARAATVKNYLSGQQVDANQMTAIGYGETDPQADNSTAEGRSQNRRITFTVTQAQ